MSKYPIKMLKDEEGKPFVPLVSADTIYTNEDISYQDALDKKLEISNLKSSDSVIIKTNGNDATFEVDFGATDNIIDNLNTTVAGQGPLDAHQGYVLKNMIPAIADNLTTSDANKTLSANQGVVLNEKIDTSVSALEQSILTKGYITRASLPLAFDFGTSSGGDAGFTEFKDMLITDACPVGITAWHINLNGAISAALVQKASNSYLSFIYWGYGLTASQQKYTAGTWTSIALA